MIRSCVRNRIMAHVPQTNVGLQAVHPPRPHSPPGEIVPDSSVPGTDVQSETFSSGEGFPLTDPISPEITSPGGCFRLPRLPVALA